MSSTSDKFEFSNVLAGVTKHSQWKHILSTKSINVWFSWLLLLVLSFDRFARKLHAHCQLLYQNVYIRRVCLCMEECHCESRKVGSGGSSLAQARYDAIRPNVKTPSFMVLQQEVLLGKTQHYSNFQLWPINYNNTTSFRLLWCLLACRYTLVSFLFVILTNWRMSWLGSWRDVYNIDLCSLISLIKSVNVEEKNDWDSEPDDKSLELQLPCIWLIL